MLPQKFLMSTPHVLFDPMAEQLAAAYAQIKNLQATLEERDINTISQLLQMSRGSVQVRSRMRWKQTDWASYQAQTLRKQEYAALNTATQIPAAGRGEPAQPHTTSGPTCASRLQVVRAQHAPGRFGGRIAGVWIRGKQRGGTICGQRGPQVSVLFFRVLKGSMGGGRAWAGTQARWSGERRCKRSLVGRVGGAGGGGWRGAP